MLLNGGDMNTHDLTKIYQINHILSPSPTYNIVCCLDNRLFGPLFVLMVSAKTYLKRPITFWILQSNFTNKEKDKLEEFCTSQGINVHIISIPYSDFEIFTSYFTHMGYPIESIYYFLSHHYLPNDIKRALFVDIDVMFLKDISYLYDIDFEDSWLVGMVDYDEKSIYEKIDLIEGKKPHVYTRILFNNECIINTGVLLLNLDKLRKENITLQSFYDIADPEVDQEIHLADQTLLNRFIGLNVKILPSYYFNCFAPRIDKYESYFQNKGKYKCVNEVYLYNKLDEGKTTSIIHFVTCTKPWKMLINIDINNEIELKPCEIQLIPLYKKWWSLPRNIPSNIYIRLVANSINSCIGHTRYEYARKLMEIKTEYGLPSYNAIWNRYIETLPSFYELYMLNSVYANILLIYLCPAIKIQISITKNLANISIYLESQKLTDSDSEFISVFLASHSSFTHSSNSTHEILSYPTLSIDDSIKLFPNLLQHLYMVFYASSIFRQKFDAHYIIPHTFHYTNLAIQYGRIICIPQNHEFYKNSEIDVYLVQNKYIYMRSRQEGNYINMIDEFGNINLKTQITLFPIRSIAYRRFAIMINKKFLSANKNGEISLVSHCKEWEIFKY